ncbi:hypothetical protein BDF20DRAFT_914889 [Mycotypha africana]|uniref:uncharacterized protein n=1 Tax=Mycotypha africana TaxID=64632 RepID=UPI0022FFCB44|nr:uncharacterized protein BDF20DRAFT_914889 [Mycotypha africana]KAI8973448.1 hypothetical protein BDF20DRAFT_914889 [Mycotypha africana]
MTVTPLWATAPTLRKRNQLYHNRSMKGTVAAKAQEKSKAANKPSYPYWAVILLIFALFGGIILQLIDYFF